MNEHASIPVRDRSAVRAHFLSRLNRYKNLLAGKWWLVILGIALGVGISFGLSSFDPPAFTSLGQMIVNIKLAIPEGSVYTEELSNFLGTQTELMRSDIVQRRAHARVSAQKSGSPRQPVSLRVNALPKTTIFVLQGTGRDPNYTEAFVQACMEEYISLKKEMRTQTSDTTVAGLTEEVLRLEKELRKSDEEMVAFQSTNSVVVLQEQGNSFGNYLQTLNQSLAAMKSELELLKALTLDQALEHQQQASATLPAAGGADDPLNSGGSGTGP